MNKQELSALCAAFGPSGREEDVSGLIRSMTEGLADETRVDALGNLILHKKGTSGRRLMLCAHMDTAGLIVTDVDERGFLRFSAVGEVENALIPGRHVRFCHGARGVAFFETADKTAAKAAATDMFIDVGAGSAAEARRAADIGDMAVFETPFADLGDRVACAAVSDRAGCAVLIECLRRVRSRHDLFFVFSAQERVGGRGAGAAAYAIRPDAAVNVHAGQAGDAPNAKRACLALGKGPGVEIMDQTAIVPAHMREKLRQAADRAIVPFQNDVLRRGGSDTFPIQRTLAGVPTGVVSLPARYLGSGAEMVDLLDADDAAKLLCAFAEGEF